MLVPSAVVSVTKYVPAGISATLKAKSRVCGASSLRSTVLPAASVTLTYTAPSGAKTVKELSGEGTTEFVIGAAGTWTLTHVAGGVTRTARFVIAAEDGIPYVSTDAELEAACADDALVEIAVDEKGDEVELTIPVGYRLAATDTEGVYRMEVWYESDGTALRTSGGASWIDAGAADAVKIDAFESLDGDGAGWDVTFKVALKDGLDFTTWFLQSALHEKVTVHMSDTLAALGTASDAVLKAAAEDVVGDPEARTVTVRFALEDATAKAAFFRIVVED